MIAVGIGALLVVIGVVWAAVTTLQRGRLSDPHPSEPADNSPTLEPEGRGKRLSLMAEAPAYLLILVGVILLLLGPLF